MCYSTEGSINISMKQQVIKQLSKQIIATGIEREILVSLIENIQENSTIEASANIPSL